MNYLKSMLIIGALLCISISTFAQGPGGRNGQRRGQGPDLERMKKALDLTDEQVDALKPIIADTREQMEGLREKEFESQEDRRAAMKAIMDGQKEKMEAVLTEEQIQKMEELQKRRQKRGGQGRRGNG